MARRLSVGQRLAQDRQVERRGVEALFAGAPAPQRQAVAAKRFEKATFYFEAGDLTGLERLWLELMRQGLRCNKSEIMTAFLKLGLEEHTRNPEQSPLLGHLGGKRRRLSG